ncbi:MAG: corrinoid protein [Oscillospiraceae bacterium]|nr:corrinoid protein [Oscillospiraceae bacterium]
MSILMEINENLQKGRSKAVCSLIQNALAENADPKELMQALLDGMEVVGEKFKRDEVFVPDVMIAARAMNNGLAILKPYLQDGGMTAKGKACIGTVKGDLHDIGKNLVKLMLEGRGFEVIDLGVDVAPETFVKTAVEQNCDLICCSALLTTTMTAMADVVTLAAEAGIRDKVKIMVGGAPVDQRFCDKIGADAYTRDAATASDVAVAYVSG